MNKYIIALKAQMFPQLKHIGDLDVTTENMKDILDKVILQDY